MQFYALPLVPNPLPQILQELDVFTIFAYNPEGDSRGTPKVATPFHFRGFQESKPPGPKPTTISWLSVLQKSKNFPTYPERNIPQTPNQQFMILAKL